jgi:hypothetical protein
MGENMINYLNIVFGSKYYIDKNNKPFSDYPELVMLKK